MIMLILTIKKLQHQLELLDLCHHLIFCMNDFIHSIK